MKATLKTKAFTSIIAIIFLFFIGILIYQNHYGISANLSDADFKKAITDFTNIDKVEINAYLYTIPSDRGQLLVFDNFQNEKVSYFSAGVGRIEELLLSVEQSDDFNGFKFHLTRSNSYPWINISAYFGTLISMAWIFISVAWIYLLISRFKGGGMMMGGESFKIEFKKTKVTFKDIAGIKEEKNELMEIVDFLKFPHKYTSLGARIPKGVLLFGPPGTGKTLLAKAVSGEAGVSFIAANGSSFEEVFVGMGASRIRELFKTAKTAAPCIIFIDEIDSLGSRRMNAGAGTQDQTLNQFLAELDGFDSRDGVILIAATNRAGNLDPALLRSGRIDRKIQINLPDIKEREEILKIHAKGKKINKNVSFRSIAERTPGFSGAQLENSLNEATLIAVRHNKKEVSIVDIDEGIDRVIGGPAKTSKVINNKTKLIVSIHEAGHATIGLLLKRAMKVQKVTIIPRGSAGGYTITTPQDETEINTKISLLEKVTGLLGGRAAEENIFGALNITTGAYDDFMKASDLVKNMVKKFGMSVTGIRFSDTDNQYFPTGSATTSNKKMEQEDAEIDNILNECMSYAKSIIKKNKKTLFLIAESLLVLETITQTELKYIIENKELPPNVVEVKKKNKDKKYFDLSIVEKVQNFHK